MTAATRRDANDQPAEERETSSISRETARASVAAGKLTRKGAEAVSDTAGSSLQSVYKTSKRATRTVTGTARWSAEQVARAARTGVRQTTGQAEAQAETVSDEVTTQAQGFRHRFSETVRSLRNAIADAADRLATRLEDGTDEVGPYETWTKEDLYERAQELDIEGRSTMTKQELIRTLRAAE